MNKILAVMVLGLLGAGVAEAQSVYPSLTKQHYSCRFSNFKNNQTVLIKDVDAYPGKETRVARVSELTDVPDLTKWILFSDVNNPNPSEAFEKGVVVACTPSSVVSPMVIGKQTSGLPYLIAHKFKFGCTYASQSGSRFILNNEMPGVDDTHAIRNARMAELYWDDRSPGRPKRWVLWSDLNNSTPSYSFNDGVKVICLPLNQRLPQSGNSTDSESSR